MKRIMPSALLLPLALLLGSTFAHAKTGQCNCYSVDAAGIKYWGTHMPARSCTGFARNDALTKAVVACQRYSGAKESCSTKKSDCEWVSNEN